MDNLPYKDRLQAFVRDILTQAKVASKHDIDRLTDSRAMATWIQAFTNENYDTRKNYEELEYIGDSTLGFMFVIYLRNLFPELRKENYSSLKGWYMSNLKQREIARKMGLSSYIRHKGAGEPTPGIVSDVFEAFFGALFELSSKLYPGSYAICFNLLIYLYTDVDIDLNYSKGAVKTNLQQIFTRFGLEKPIDQIVTLPDGQVQVTLTLDQPQVDFLKLYKVDLSNNRMLATSIAPTQTEAENLAYGDALAKLRALGITPEWAQQVRRLEEMRDPSIVPYVKPAIEKLRRDHPNASGIYFKASSKGVNKYQGTTNLIGLVDNVEKVLATQNFEYPVGTTSSAERGELERNQRLLLIKKYVDQA